MLYGSMEELTGILKEDSDIFKTISKDFKDDYEITNALDVFNDMVANNELTPENFTKNAGDIIDFTSNEYENIIKLISEMRKIHFNIINSISLSGEVNLKGYDLSKVSEKVSEEIKKLEEIKLQVDSLVSKIMSFLVVNSKLILRDNKSLEKDNSLDEIENLLTEDQYILGETLEGDYYLSISSKLDENEISNIKKEIAIQKPELSETKFKIDHGEVILSEGYKIIINGYIKKEEKTSNLITEETDVKNKDDILNNLLFIDNEKSEKENKGSVKIEDDNLVIKEPEEEPIKETEEENTEPQIPIFEMPPLDIETNETPVNNNVTFETETSNSDIFNVKPEFEHDNTNSQFTFGKKDETYYLVINPEISAEDVQDIKMTIAESFPELAGTSFIIDYGNILSDSSFKVLLTGFVKEKSSSMTR